MLPSDIADKLYSGCVIPAHPLALSDDLTLDERRQKGLTRYYLDAGAGGLAVAVHTTQFAIHNPRIGLYKPVLQLAAATAADYVNSGRCTAPIMIAGLLGNTDQACAEAAVARDLGYHLGLLSLTALRDKPLNALLDHARKVAEIIPIVGFYLQQTISQMVLPGEFWRQFVEIPNVLAIKIAPFNRYQSLDVLQAVAASDRVDKIALYTGNDDNIITDLLTPYEFNINNRTVSLQIVGGLLGQWACWTKRAVEQLNRIRQIRESIAPVPQDLLTLASQMTLANKALFDADNNFTGCIPGISYVLEKQGLLANSLTLDPADRLSPGQTERIDRIITDYPHLADDTFVAQYLDTWLA